MNKLCACMGCLDAHNVQLSLYVIIRVLQPIPNRFVVMQLVCPERFVVETMEEGAGFDGIQCIAPPPRL
eukprot:1459158-Pleurochrysis_carterae.AAC.1